VRNMEAPPVPVPASQPRPLPGQIVPNTGFSRRPIPSGMPFAAPAVSVTPQPPPVAPPVAPPPAPPPPIAPPPPPPIAPPPPSAPSAAPALSPWALGAPNTKPEPPAVRPPLQSVSFSPPSSESTPLPRPAAERVVEVPAARVSAPAASATPTREAMTLLWLDDSKAETIVAMPQWTKLLSEAEKEEEPELPAKGAKDDEEEDYFAEEEPEEEEEPEDVKQRKRVCKILARGEPSDGPGLAIAVTNAVNKNGILEPPMMLASGELSFPFEAWETVKALLIAATPAAVSDKKLKEMLDSVQETSKAPGIERSTSIAEGLASRLREAFLQTNRQVGPNWLDAQAERMLLEGRHYQKRSVLGQTFLRCLLHTPGAEEGIPTYLPEALAKTLPMVSKLRVRVMAEVHASQDQYETYPRCLRVYALGRMVDVSGNRAR